MSKNCPLCGGEIPLDLLGEPNLKPGQRFIKAYCDAWTARWKVKAIISGSEAGCGNRIVKDVGLDQAIALVQSYVEMNDPFFVTRRHDLKTFSSNLGKVKIYHETGGSLSQREVQQMDRREANKNAFMELLEDERD